jgi:ABC-2 type transport system permease protein
MINQLKVEWFKLRSFWLLYIAAILLFSAGFFYGYLKFPDYCSTNHIFAIVVCDTSFMFVISLVTAWFIGNDFSSRTVHNEIKIGYSRLSILISRAITVFMVSILLHILYIISTIIGFSLKHGFDKSIFNTQNVFWLFTVIIQIIAMQSIIILITFTLRKAAASISAAICFSFIACNSLRNFLNDDIFKLSCFCLAQNKLTRTLAFSGLFAALTFTAVIAVTNIIFRKAEIK